MISQFLDDMRSHGEEAGSFPGGHLEKQTRGRCPHILALANTRTALRAWREDSGDITRILLTVVADPLARQKGKDYGPSYLKLGIFSLRPKIIMCYA